MFFVVSNSYFSKKELCSFSCLPSYLHRRFRFSALLHLLAVIWNYALTSVSRNETYCITGSIALHVYESSSVDMEKLSYQISAVVGEKLTLRCPSVNHFNKTEKQIEWYKVRKTLPTLTFESTLIVQWSVGWDFLCDFNKSWLEFDIFM